LRSISAGGVWRASVAYPNSCAQSRARTIAQWKRDLFEEVTPQPPESPRI
jgi:hypothetical protein